MGIQDQATNNQQTRDELSSEPDTQPIYKIKSETLKVEEASSKTSNVSVGHSFILGHAANGVLGVANGDDGSQIVLGSAGRVTTTTRVVNPNNEYRERFNFNTFEDTSTTTADWADTIGTLVMTAGEIAQSKSVAYGGGNIQVATLNITFSVGSTSTVAKQMSVDGGAHWENVGLGLEKTFTNTGGDLRFKLTAVGDTTITFISIQYS